MTPLTAPAVPPLSIVTEFDQQKQAAYEDWLHRNQQILEMQQNHYQAEVDRFRKVCISIMILNSIDNCILICHAFSLRYERLWSPGKDN
jgi:hypothetical protein